MTPKEIYSSVLHFSGEPATIICELHSACSPKKRKTYLCARAGSNTPVIDFDRVKTLVDKAKRIKARKSVDALTITPSTKYLCFVELKSWELLIVNNVDERAVREKATRYASDLPLKLSSSMRICEDITGDINTFHDCAILYILATDVMVEDDGIAAFNADLTALAGISSNLRELCNSLSKGIMANIDVVETRYWECRQLDNKMSLL